MLGVSEADKCWWERKLKQQKVEEAKARRIELVLQKQELLARKQGMEHLAKQEKLDRQRRLQLDVPNALSSALIADACVSLSLCVCISSSDLMERMQRRKGRDGGCQKASTYSVQGRDDTVKEPRKARQRSPHFPSQKGLFQVLPIQVCARLAVV